MPSLEDLVQYLREAVETTYPNETISIPRNIINTAQGLSHSPVSADIDSLVELFDGLHEGSCSRLDVLSFQCILYVLLRGQWGLAQERGLYLFLSHIRDLTDGSRKTEQWGAFTSLKLKSEIGQKTLQLCLTHFTDADGPGIPRRWSGRFLLELIRESSDNKELLASAPEETRRGIGKIVLSGPDPVLRFIGANIIREMVSTQSDLKIFRPFGSNEKLVTAFPLSRYAGPGWIENFYSFFSEVDRDKGPNAPEKEYMGIAQSTITGDSSFPVIDSTLIVITTHGITLVQAEPSDNTVQYFDIMFENIERCGYQRGHPLTVDFELSQYCRENYVKDGSMMKADRISLLFRSEKQVHELLRVVGRKAPQLYRTKSSPETHGERRHMAVAYIALAGSSFPRGISPGVGPIPRSATHIEKEQSRISRVSSFAVLSLPSQEEVVARSSGFLERHLSGENDIIPAGESDNPTSLGDCPDLIESSDILGARKKPRKMGTTENSHELSKLDMQDMLRQTEVENEKRVAYSQDTRREEKERDVGDGENLPTILQVKEFKGSSSMRLQQNEGSEAQPGLPSPIQETALSLLQGNNNPIRISATPGPDHSQVDCLQQVGHNDISSVRESGVGSIEIPDSQPGRTCSKEPRLESKMVSVDSATPAEIQTLPNTVETPITPAEIGSASRLKRPRQKATGTGVRKATVDWEQDLRPSPNGQQRSSNKTSKMSDSKIPMPAKVKNPPNTKANRKGKSMPKTPRIETPETMRKPKSVKKRQPTKTLTSSRQLRTAAGKAKEKIARVKYDETENFDIEDPIESTSPELSPIETPMNKHELPKKFPATGQAGVSSQPTLDTVCNKHDPIILDSAHLDEVVAVPQSSEKSPIAPAPKESIIIETSLQDLDSTLLGCLSSQPSFHGVHTHAHPVDQPTSTHGVFSPNESAFLKPLDGVRPECISERASSALAESDSSRRPTFAEKLSLALVGTGILSVDDLDSGEGSILRIEESCPSKETGIVEDTSLCTKENVSRVSQNVVEFMSRQVKPRTLSTKTENKVTTASPGPQGLEKRISGVVYNSHCTKSVQDADTPGRVDNGGIGNRLVDGVEPMVRVEDIDTRLKGAISNHPLKSTLVDDRVHRKTQVVSFDMHGPRNQGLSPTKKPPNRASKIITPILKERENSAVSKRQVDAELKERRQPEEEPSLGPKAKRRMIQHLQDGPGTIADADPDAVDALFESEILAHSQAPQPFGSQQSVVDINGSPHHVANVPREPRLLARVKNKRVTENGRQRQQRGKQPSVVELKKGYQNNQDNIQNQSSEEDMDIDDGDSVCLVSTFEPVQQEKSMQEEEERRQDPSRMGFLLAPKPSVQTSIAEHKTQEPINLPDSGFKPSHFIDSLRSKIKTMDHSFDTDSEAETVIEDHDSASVSSYSTESTSSESSETLVPPCTDADMEWRNALRSTQKTTLDILLDTSKRLVRHLVDEETAIMDLVTIYQNGCEKLLEQLQNAHDTSLEERERRMQPVRKNLLGIYESANARLKTGRKKVQKLPSTKELLSATRKRKGLLSRLGDVLKEYDIETGC